MIDSDVLDSESCLVELTHWRLGDLNIILKNIIFNPVLLIGILKSSHDNALPWMPEVLTEDNSTLIQVMASCRQETGHCLSQCWLSALSPYGVSRPQWANLLNGISYFIFEWYPDLYLKFKYQITAELFTRHDSSGVYGCFVFIQSPVDTYGILYSVSEWHPIPYIWNSSAKITTAMRLWCVRIFVIVQSDQYLRHLIFVFERFPIRCIWMVSHSVIRI